MQFGGQNLPRKSSTQFPSHASMIQYLHGFTHHPLYHQHSLYPLPAPQVQSRLPALHLPPLITSTFTISSASSVDKAGSELLACCCRAATLGANSTLDIQECIGVEWPEWTKEGLFGIQNQDHV